jgi:hypothetical protein
MMRRIKERPPFGAPEAGLYGFHGVVQRVRGAGCAKGHDPKRVRACEYHRGGECLPAVGVLVFIASNRQSILDYMPHLVAGHLDGDATSAPFSA